MQFAWQSCSIKYQSLKEIKRLKLKSTQNKTPFLYFTEPISQLINRWLIFESNKKIKKIFQTIQNRLNRDFKVKENIKKRSN